MARILIQNLWLSLQKALHSPFGFQVSVFTFFLFFLFSFQPFYKYNTTHNVFENFDSYDYQAYSVSEPGFFDNYSTLRTTGLIEEIVIDADGNETLVVRPRNRESVIEYRVKSGDNISKIAYRFGLKISTLNWANDINARQTLQIGQILRIPVTDGVFYTTQTGDTLSEIAKTHSIPTSKIFAYNNLKDEKSLQVGQELFLPEAQKIFIPQRTIVNNNNGILKQATPIATDMPGNINAFIKPTQGVITQGYHSEHYALDIANKWHTPIYAAAAGTVITSQEGWNGGYGNYVIIDHGNDVKTLYAHNDINKVSVGDTVEAGQLVSLMGNSGRVIGRTGIHLHFEIRIRGRKVNPLNYF